MTSKIAIIYGRVSTKGQADEELPIDGQVEACRKKAEQLGAQVAKVYVDAGISGRTDERDAFQDAVLYCKTHQVDYFICWSTSRFARNKIDAALYKRDLEKRGTKVAYVSVNIDGGTNEGWITESIFELFDELYSRQVSADTMRSMMKNARDGYFNGGRVPFGYSAQPEGKRKRLAIDQTEADLVRWIFRTYTEGQGVKSITVQLNQAGRSRRGRKWDKNTVINLLKNDVYTGYVVFNRVNGKTGKVRPRDEWIMTKSHPGIIDQDHFDEVQQTFLDRAPLLAGGTTRSNFVFSGLLRCGRCDATLQTESATGRTAVYHYYNCRSAQRGTGCKHRRLPAADLDKHLIRDILGRMFTEQFLQDMIGSLHLQAGSWIKKRESKRDSLVRELRDVESRLSNLYGVLELHGKAAPNLADLTERMHALRDQRAKLERGLTELEEMDPPALQIEPGDVAELHQLLHAIVTENTDPRKQRAFFSGFITKIVVGEDNCEITYRPDRLVNHAGTQLVHSNGIWLPDLDSNQGPAD